MCVVCLDKLEFTVIDRVGVQQQISKSTSSKRKGTGHMNLWIASLRFKFSETL